VCVHVALALRLKLKSWETLVFTDLWFDTYVLLMWLSSEKYKFAPWKKKDFEDLDDLLVSFLLRLVIAEDNSCIFSMYYLLWWIYVVLVVKKMFITLFNPYYVLLI
jgi:hypothetical protein